MTADCQFQTYKSHITDVVLPQVLFFQKGLMKTNINSASDNITLIKQINNTNLYFYNKSGALQILYL